MNLEDQIIYIKRNFLKMAFKKQWEHIEKELFNLYDLDDDGYISFSDLECFESLIESDYIENFHPKT